MFLTCELRRPCAPESLRFQSARARRDDRARTAKPELDRANRRFRRRQGDRRFGSGHRECACGWSEGLHSRETPARGTAPAGGRSALRWSRPRRLPHRARASRTCRRSWGLWRVSFRTGKISTSATLTPGFSRNRIIDPSLTFPVAVVMTLTAPDCGGAPSVIEVGRNRDRQRRKRRRCLSGSGNEETAKRRCCERCGQGGSAPARSKASPAMRHGYVLSFGWSRPTGWSRPPVTRFDR